MLCHEKSELNQLNKEKEELEKLLSTRNIFCGEVYFVNTKIILQIELLNPFIPVAQEYSH